MLNVPLGYVPEVAARVSGKIVDILGGEVS